MKLEWQLAVFVIFGSLAVLLAMGMPVAFSFFLVNIVGAYLFWGGLPGLKQLILSLSASVASFNLMPLPLFIIMGEVLFYSGLAPDMIDAIAKWLGRTPGRLSLLAVASGTLLATLTGASMASVAILGSVLVPEMEKRGYKKPMTLGPILGSGGLAIMIPPTSLAVLLGAIAYISIGKILIAIILPGFLTACIYAAYIIVRCRLQPELAPSYDIFSHPLRQKLLDAVHYIMPVGIIIFLVIGVIILGIATPTEAAATGATGSFLLAALYKKLNWEVVKKSIASALPTTIMIFMIICAATAFSQVLAYSGATSGMIEVIKGLPISPIMVIILMQLVVFFLGCFMDVVGIMMVTLPIFMPLVNDLRIDPVWFAVMYLINIEMATITPPYGLSLFTMKGVAPAGTTMGDVYRAAYPFVLLDIFSMALIMAFPSIALWLVGIMR
jgi:tripartite ATP-independent transporter DctM subunit